ncbi:MAG TPA: hypothetical protein PLB25_11500 [Rhodoferax sp.]|nr:hypothetical protein [Rhodoferax sp.]
MRERATPGLNALSLLLMFAPAMLALTMMRGAISSTSSAPASDTVNIGVDHDRL